VLNPESIPQFTGDLDALEQDYTALRTDAGHIRSAGQDIHNRFQGLSAYYTAPEAEQLFATTQPVKDRADTFADDLETVSGALAEYAAEVRPLKQKLEQLKQEATTFVNAVKDDKDWNDDGDKVDEYSRIRDEITQTVAAFWAAERTCHNKITALWHGTQMVAGDGTNKKNQYGFNAEDLKNAKLPWGEPVEEKHHWWEVGHWVKSFVWDGLIVDGVWGTIKGLGTLVGFGGWKAMGQAWKGLAQLATGLALSAMPGTAALFWTLPDDKLPSWIRDSRTALKQTGKALVAWDEWSKNPARAAGAVTFNVLTTVFTGGAGGAASGAGKAGAVARAISLAGKAGHFIDPMTYVAKAAGAGLSKIGDITKALKGVGNIDIPQLPENAITLPEGSLKLPDGTVHLPEGSPIPHGATQLPNGTIELPHDVPVLPEGTTKLPSVDGSPAQYMDPHGNLLDHQGNILQHADQAPTDFVDKPHTESGSPAAGADSPHTPTPAKQPAMAAAGAHTTEQAGHHIHLGNSLDHDLGDLGRIGDDLPTTTVHAGGDLPGSSLGDHLPGGHAGDHIPSGRSDDHLPSETAEHLPGATAYEHSPGPSASHEPGAYHGGSHESLSHKTEHADSSYDPQKHTATHSHHGDDGAHSAEHTSGDHLGDGHVDDNRHVDSSGTDTGHAHDDTTEDAGSEPHGVPLDPQPDWHGQSAGHMRHYRRPALDVSHLTREQQILVTRREAERLADEAVNATPGVAAPGQNRLISGCAGSFLHDNVITVHTSTTKMHGQTLPHTHQVLQAFLDQLSDDAAAGRLSAIGRGHGKCAEISLISDRLYQYEQSGTKIKTLQDARRILEGGIIHTRRIHGKTKIGKDGAVLSHNDYLPPCATCKHVLSVLGIHAL
jgi:hypothetical protein